MEPENYNEIGLDEIEDFIGNEMCIILHTGTRYFGILKDADDEELVLTSPKTHIGLGFQLAWVNTIFVKEER